MPLAIPSADQCIRLLELNIQLFLFYDLLQPTTANKSNCDNIRQNRDLWVHNTHNNQCS